MIPGGVNTRISSIVAAGARVFFTGVSTTIGTEFYVSNGTVTGMRLVVDLIPGSPSSMPQDLIGAGNGVYFSAEEGSAGRELYDSDGTAAGTRRLCDLSYGPTSGYPRDLTLMAGDFYFTAKSDQHGRKLFVIRKDRGVVQAYGGGCGGDGPKLRAVTHPVLGGRFELAGDAAPASGARLLAAGAARLPYSLPGLTAPGCALWLDLSTAVLLPIGGGRSWARQFQIPNNPALAGLELTLQAAFEPGLQLNGALHATLGR